jgi:hypothetical protein
MAEISGGFFEYNRGSGDTFYKSHHSTAAAGLQPR